MYRSRVEVEEDDVKQRDENEAVVVAVGASPSPHLVDC